MAAYQGFGVGDLEERMNGVVRESYPITGPFPDACLNLVQAPQCFYQYSDGHGVPGGETKNHLMSVLAQPVPMKENKYKEGYVGMKEYVKGLIEANQAKSLIKLELIDAVQQLGLQYLFDAEIKHALGTINKRANDSQFSSDLYATSLRFRLLRQHGYDVSQDVFKCFMDKTGNFKESVYEDVEGLLSVYEAPFHGLKGEAIIDEVMDLSCTYLKAVDKGKLPERLALKVDHALDMPIHGRPNRLVARWFIDVYEEGPSMNPTLLKLAKLDYNLVQSTYMKEVRELARWWVGLGNSKMSFFRDRLVECYLWGALTVFENI